MKTPCILCHHCDGTGRRPLVPELRETYQRLRRSRVPLTTADLMEPGITRNAISNRLTDLESLGLAYVVGKQSKSKLWMANR